MNEITRIHLAKIAYDIEVTAKKQLEKYISSLQTYTADKEVLEDIEIRMTELLAERGVAAGGVVSVDDVKAIREQLGEPHEFAGDEGDIAVGGVSATESKRFYRDEDNAVLGGVLSGFAAYLNVDVIWVRIAFIVLSFVSFGLAVLLYLILWVITPAAQTATDKLRQVGRPVTVESIREINAVEAMAPRNAIAPFVKRAISIILGAGTLLAALVTLMVVVVGSARFSTQDFGNFMGLQGAPQDIVALSWVLFGLVVTGLLLLAALFSLATYALFTQKFTKRILMSGLVIIILGLATCAGTVGIIGSQTWRIETAAREMTTETSVKLPANFAQVTSLTIEETEALGEDASTYAMIEYIVTDKAPRYEVQGVPGIKPEIKIDGTSATVKLVLPDDFRTSIVDTRLTIYGPALTQLTNHAGSLEYSATKQSVLEIIGANDASSLIVNSGTFETVTVKGSGNVDLGLATVATLDVNAENGLMVNAGTVRDLKVSQPDVCPAGSGATSSVDVENVTSNRMTYNGEERDAQTIHNSCSELIIGEELSHHTRT